MAELWWWKYRGLNRIEWFCILVVSGRGYRGVLRVEMICIYI